MMSLQRAWIATGMAALTGIAVAGGVAWACTPQPRVVAVSAESGPPRSTVNVRGEAVAPEGPVQLRWNGVNGVVIANAMADETGSFSAPVRIPEALPGVYTISVVGRDVALGRVPFEVTPASAGAAAKPSEWTTPVGARHTGGSGVDPFAIGVGLLGAGAMALSSGAAWAAIGRRKALATAGRTNQE